MTRFLSLLRSWLKEERRLLPRAARPGWIALGSMGLLGLLLIVETQRRHAQITAAQDSQRLEQLELVDAALGGLRRTVFDWARWDDSLRFVQGRNPSFVQRDIAQSSLFTAGGVMVVIPPGSPSGPLQRGGDRSPR